MQRQPPRDPAPTAAAPRHAARQVAVLWCRRAPGGLASCAPPGDVGGERASRLALGKRLRPPPPLSRPLSSRVVLVSESRRPVQRLRRLSPSAPARWPPAAPPRGERGSSFCARARRAHWRGY